MEVPGTPTDSTWVKGVARRCPHIVWSIEPLLHSDGLQVGPIFWKADEALMIRYGSPLGHVFQRQGAFATTNIDDLITTANREVDAAIDAAIAEIDTVMRMDPGSTRPDCSKMLGTFVHQYGLMVLGMHACRIVYDRLSEKMESGKFGQIKNHVIHPYKKTLIGREHEAIDNARRIYSLGQMKGDELSALAQELAETYGFIHAEYLGDEWTAEDYLGEIKRAGVEQSSDAEQVLSDDDAYLDWLLDLARRCAYVYDEGKMSVVRAMWCLRKTVAASGAEERIVLNLTKSEFMQWVEDGTVPDIDVAARCEYSAVHTTEVIPDIFGKESVDEIIRAEGIREFEIIDHRSRDIKGTPAYFGVVRGKVRITLAQSDAVALEEGEILVASMTTPELIVAMRKASAFVTDEGGIACHAAIIARELRKPCIVGTKIATRVLKDGDMVEVDADKGVVRILS